jgi:hypothetical protein
MCAPRLERPQVRAELAPWEKRKAEINKRVGVAKKEMELLQRGQNEAKQRLQAAERCGLSDRGPLRRVLCAAQPVAASSP